MPAVGDILIEELCLSHKQLKIARRMQRQNRFLGMEDSYSGVSFIPVALTDVKRREKYLVQKMLTC